MEVFEVMVSRVREMKGGKMFKTSVTTITVLAETAELAVEKAKDSFDFRAQLLVVDVT